MSAPHDVADSGYDTDATEPGSPLEPPSDVEEEKNEDGAAAAEVEGRDAGHTSIAGVTGRGREACVKVEGASAFPDGNDADLRVSKRRRAGEEVETGRITTRGGRTRKHGCPFSAGSSCDTQGDFRIHVGEKPLKCGTCVEGFARLAPERPTPKKRSRTRSRKKPFKCDTCGVAFAERSKLRVHIRTHTGEKPFQCATCGRRFTQAGQLKCHTRVHTGEKPFKCDTCGATFTQKGNMMDHVRVHTGEKPFQCGVCPYKARTASQLMNHERAMHGMTR